MTHQCGVSGRQARECMCLFASKHQAGLAGEQEIRGAGKRAQHSG